MTDDEEVSEEISTNISYKEDVAFKDFCLKHMRNAITFLQRTNYQLRESEKCLLEKCDAQQALIAALECRMNELETNEEMLQQQIHDLEANHSTNVSHQVQSPKYSPPITPFRSLRLTTPIHRESVAAAEEWTQTPVTRSLTDSGCNASPPVLSPTVDKFSRLVATASARVSEVKQRLLDHAEEWKGLLDTGLVLHQRLCSLSTTLADVLPEDDHPVFFHQEPQLLDEAFANKSTSTNELCEEFEFHLDEQLCLYQAMQERLERLEARNQRQLHLVKEDKSTQTNLGSTNAEQRQMVKQTIIILMEVEQQLLSLTPRCWDHPWNSDDRSSLGDMTSEFDSSQLSVSLCSSVLAMISTLENLKTERKEGLQQRLSHSNTSLRELKHCS